jgi:hypothetical protein
MDEVFIILKNNLDIRVSSFNHDKCVGVGSPLPWVNWHLYTFHYHFHPLCQVK